MLSRTLTIAVALGFLFTPTSHANPQAAKTLPPAAEAEAAPMPKARPLPFQGRVDRVNKEEGTFTIRTKGGKEHLFHLTPETKIEKADGPATIEDIVPEGIVRGSRIKLADYKWEARKVIIGAKEPGEEGGRRKRK